MSPKKDNDQSSTLKTPPRWKRPDEVMRLHRLRTKHKALQARMSNSQISSQELQLNTSLDSAITKDGDKRKNPFKKCYTPDICNSNKRNKPGLELSDDNTNNLSVFDFLSHNETTTQEKRLSFKNIFSQMTESSQDIKVDFNESKGSENIPVDWKLRTKVRFMSLKPFAWSSKLKTCEEASGTTAFVRCLDTTSSNENCFLDTSANAQFHQRCLVWQHPQLPWMELYPRHGHIQNNAAAPLFSYQNVRDSMHMAWTESFRSVFQLLRAQQCPYFYILANTFTCLFRAAGICGHSELHALISPTTSGFRQLLKAEEIEYLMPLKEKDSKRRSFENQSDTGYNTLDTSTADETIGSINDESFISKCMNSGEIKSNYHDEEEMEDDEKWLHSMGVDENEIRRISNSQNDIEFNKERQIDKKSESLVYVEGIEAQALFNLLMNCKSNIATTGPFAGIPPTILAPVAFHGATLRPLKVRQNTVNMGMEQYYSMELRGPILPHIVHFLTDLLKESSDTFSLTFASIESTSAFTAMHQKRCAKQMTDDKTVEATNSKLNTPTKSCSNITTFGQVNLSDCGLINNVLKCFCRSDSEAVQSFDSLKYSDSLYTWS